MATYRILSFDGGGIRGIVTAIILDRLQQTFPGFLNQVDLMAGTSTGGLLALGLRAGKTPQELRNLYLNRSDDIFEDSLLDDIVDLGGLTGAEYDSKPREKVFKQVLGPNRRLQDLSGRVLIPAFDLKNTTNSGEPGVWKPKLFHNFPGGDSDGGVKAWKVAMYTTAAPTYFPSFEGFIDGGVYANNPCMCALAQTQDEDNNVTPKLKDIRLLSLGTGLNRRSIPGQKKDWGLAQWAPHFVDVMTDGSMDVARYQCARLLNDNFHRFAPYLPNNKEIKLDGLGQLGWLKHWAENLDLSEVEQWVQQQWV